MWNNYSPCSETSEVVQEKFCLSRIFKIFGKEKIRSYPKVQACVENKLTVVSIDNQLVLLKNDVLSKCSFVSFNSPIDCFVVSETGNAVFCFLSDGTIHAVTIEGSPISNWKINNADVSKEGKSFVIAQVYGDKIYLGCSAGCVYRLNIENLNKSKKLDDHKITGETNLLSIIENKQLERLIEFRIEQNIVSYAFILRQLEPQSDLVLAQIVYTSGNVIYFVSGSNIQEVCMPESCEGIKKLYTVDQFIVGLSNSGHVFKVFPHINQLRFLIEEFNFLIDDLIVIKNSNKTVDFLISTKNKSNILLINFPAGKVLYKFAVSCDIWLVYQSKDLTNLYYITAEDPTQENIPQKIIMNLIIEMTPKERIKRLIERRKWDEAEKLGRSIGWTLEMIHEAKAFQLIADINSPDQGNKRLIAENFKQLLENFKLIDDEIFFFKIRYIKMPNAQMLSQYLKEVVKHLKYSKHEKAVLEIKEQQLRIETLNMLGSSFEEHLKWQKFVYHSNLLQVCTSLLDKDLPSASLIWKRHLATIRPLLTESNIMTMLDKFPPLTELFDIVQWLEHFVPTIVQIYRHMTANLADWCIEKTLSLQYSNQWPDIGVKFVTNIVNIFENINFIYFHVSGQYDITLEKLRNVLYSLQDLANLQRSYNFKLTLDSYNRNSMDSSALCILQAVPLVHLHDVVNKFLDPMCNEKGIDVMLIIEKHLDNIIKNRGRSCDWLKRAVASIFLLQNEEKKLCYAASILKLTPVPWDAVVEPLTKLRYSSNPLACAIANECESQKIKILRVKYGWSPNSKESNIRLVHRVLLVDWSDMIADIIKIGQLCPEIKDRAYIFTFYEMLKKGRTQEAIDFYKNLKKEDRIRNHANLFSVIPNMLQDGNSIENPADFIQFLKSISSNSKIEENFKNYLKVLKLKECYGLNVTKNRLCSKKHKLAYLRKGCESFEKKLRICEINVIDVAWNYIKDLTKCLGMERILGVIELMKQMQCIEFSCALVYNVLIRTSISDLECNHVLDLATLLIAQQTLSDLEDKEKEFDPLAYALAHRILVESECTTFHQFQILEFMRWTQIGRNLYNITVIEDYYETDEAKKNVIKSLNRAQEIENKKKRESITMFEQVLNISDSAKTMKLDNAIALKCFSFGLLSILLDLNLKNTVLLRILPFVENRVTIPIEELKSTFLGYLSQLIKLKNRNWIRVGKRILKYQTLARKTSIISSLFVSVQIEKYIYYLLSQKEIDFNDIFYLIAAEKSPDSCFEYLSTKLTKGQQRINFFILCEIYHTRKGNIDQALVYKRSRMKCYYFMELCKQDPYLKNKSEINFVSVSELLAEVQNKIIDVDLLKNLSRDFGWDYDDVLTTQIMCALKQVKPIYEIINECSGEEELSMKITTEEINEICQPYIVELKNIDLLVTKLIDFINEIHFYFYELYLSVIDILTSLQALPENMKTWESILIFLRNNMVQKRYYDVGQLEAEWWRQSHNELGIMTKLAKFRFPFKPFICNPLKVVLGKEINLSNYNNWLPLVELYIKLSESWTQEKIDQEVDNLCMIAAKNSIYDYKHKKDKIGNDKWRLRPLQNALLQSIVGLTKHMNDPLNILFTLYFWSNQAPEGADQVEAIQESHTFALKHENDFESHEQAKEIARKIQQKYHILHTQHMLHVFNVFSDHFCQLLDHPQQLISELYHLDLILKPIKPDINKLAGKIAELRGLDFSEIQVNLLQKWLSPSSTEDFEETYYGDPNISSTLSGGSNEENVIRAQYILNSWESTEAVKFLLCYMMPLKTKANTDQALQIIECFGRLSNISPSELNLAEGVINQKMYIAIKCTNGLKELGINLSVDEFLISNHLNILKKIWQKHYNDHNALITMSQICIAFNITIIQIWNGILLQMVKFNMVQQLNAMVDLLSCYSDILHSEGLEKAWECVLKAPFKNARRAQSNEHETILQKNLRRLQRCPLVNKINLTEIAEICVEISRAHMAAVLIAFCDDDQRNTILTMLKKIKNTNMEKDIIDLQKIGIFPVVIQTALKHLNF